MKLHSKQLEAIRYALDDDIKTLYITGAGGTGKSEIIKKITSKLNNYILLAPTQSAALRIQGQTLHSFFKIKPTINTDVKKEEDVVRFLLDSLEKENLDKADDEIVIIDEASMLGEKVLKNLLSKIKPKKLILLGDPEQLPPIKDEPISWKKYCEKTIELTKNYRVNNNELDSIIKNYRDNSKLGDIRKTKNIKYNKDSIYIAFSNKTLSLLQKKLLGYYHAKKGDKVISFGQCDDNIKRKIPFKDKIIEVNYFKNNDKLIITSTPKEIEDGLWKCEVLRYDNVEISSNKYKNQPYVIVGNYDKYKEILNDRFLEARNFQTKLIEKYKSNRAFLKDLINLDEEDNLSYKWRSYFEIKNSPYAKHHQFRTTYKAQGQSFNKVVVKWEDLPNKEHKYVAISRAKNKLTII